MRRATVGLGWPGNASSASCRLPTARRRTTCSPSCPRPSATACFPRSSWSRCRSARSLYESGGQLRPRVLPDRLASSRCSTSWRTARRRRSPSSATKASSASRCSWAARPRRAAPSCRAPATPIGCRRSVLKEEFHRGGAMQHLLLRYTQALITQMAQTAVCNRHHSVDQQLCRWLLLSLDRLPSQRADDDAGADRQHARRAPRRRDRGRRQAAGGGRDPATAAATSRCSTGRRSRRASASATRWSRRSSIACCPPGTRADPPGPPTSLPADRNREVDRLPL